MTHRSQTSLTLATLDFFPFGSNDSPPNKLSAFLVVGQKQKKMLPITFHPQHHLCQADSNSSNLWPTLEDYPNHMCESLLPSNTHIHTQATWCVVGVGWLGGSQNQRSKSSKLKDLQTVHLFLSQAGMLLIKQLPQCEPATRRCRLEWAFAFSKPFQKKRRAQTLNVFSVSEWV